MWLVDQLVRRRPVVVTEPEAFMALLRHLRLCPSCEIHQLATCDEGVRLHEVWRKAAALQGAPPKQRGRRLV